MLFLGVPVVGLFRAPVDQRGEWQGWAREWKLLWRRAERTRRSVRPGRMWHVLESVSKGIPGGGHHIWLLYLRHWKLERARREYISVERIQWKPKQGQWPRDRYHPLSIRLAGRCLPIRSFISSSTNKHFFCEHFLPLWRCSYIVIWNILYRLFKILLDFMSFQNLNFHSVA